MDFLRRNRFWEYALLVGFPLLVFAHSLTNDFVAFDDELLIIDNPIARGLSIENIGRAFSSYDPELYVPLTLLAYQVNYSLFELNPVAYHVTSLIFHVANVVLVFGILLYFLDRRVALFIALLFGLHPMNVEAVSWASGLKDLLSSFFFLFSLWTYLRWRSIGKGYRASVVLFACGLLSKVSVVPLPFILLLVDWYQGRTIDNQCLKEKIPYFALAAVFVVIALFGKSQASHIGTWLLLSFVSIPFYVLSYIAPIRLSLFYPFTDPVTVMNSSIIVGFVATVAISGAVFWSLRRTKNFAFAWLWFLLLLAPSFPTVLKGGEDNRFFLYFASDRYVYLAGLGILILFGSFLRGRLWKWLLPLVAVFGILAYKQSIVWRTSEALFANVVRQERPAYIAYLNLAGIHAQREEFDEAIALYERSIEIEPTSTAMLNLAQVLSRQNRDAEAIEVYKRILELWPNSAGIHLNIGTLYLYLGDAGSAFPYLQKSIELDPTLISGHFNLGIIYEYRKQIPEAIREFRAALAIDPADEQSRKKLQEYGEALPPIPGGETGTP